MLKLIVFVQSFTRRLKKDHVNAYSAQSAYFIILSAIPFIMFILTLLRFLPLDSQNFTDGLLSLIPAETHSLAVTIINEIYGKTTGTLLSISIIILLWTCLLYTSDMSETEYFEEKSKLEVKLDAVNQKLSALESGAISDVTSE